MDHLFFTAEQTREWGRLFQEQFPQAAATAVADADRWCRSHVITRKGQEIDLGTPINWLYNPTGDKEFTWGLNRFKHLRCLGIAYAMTGDEQYAAKALEHVIGWIDTQPCPHGLPAEELTYFQRPGPWRLLEVGLRLRQWVHAYHFFCGSQSWNEAAMARFLASVKEHAEFLSTYKASIEINHSIMHMIGLLAASLTFDSWPESERWRQCAVSRLEECIRVQVLPDGVHAELTPHYHMVSLELFVDCAVMLGKRGLAFSDEYERILAGMVQFARSMTRQDGMMAPFADSYATAPPDLNAAALYYGQPGWLLEEELHEQFWLAGPERVSALLNQRRASAPRTSQGAVLPFAFEEGGYYGLGDGEQQLIFDAGALGGPHGHADALSFEWCAHGEALFVDPGVYTYMENPWRRYFKSTAAHNTVLVDGQDQTPYLRTQRWGEPEAAVTLVHWDAKRQMICAEHDGYAQRGIIHRRALWFLASGEWVIIDRLLGSGVHTYQHRLHSRLLEWRLEKLDAQAAQPGAAAGGAAGVAAGGQDASCEAAAYLASGSGLVGGERPELGCDLLLLGPPSLELDVEDSWESVVSMALQPLKVVQGLLTAQGDAWFATVMKPHTGESSLLPAEWGVRFEQGEPVLYRHGAAGEQRFASGTGLPAADTE